MRRTVIVILIGLLIVGMLFVLTGCGSNKEDISKVNELKEKVEKVISKMCSHVTYKDKEAAQAAFLAFGRDLYIELEELDNKGNSYIMECSEISENIPDSIKNDSEILCIYIASEKHSDVWTYGTVDINTGKISWHDNY